MTCPIGEHIVEWKVEGYVRGRWMVCECCSKQHANEVLKRLREEDPESITLALYEVHKIRRA